MTPPPPGWPFERRASWLLKIGVAFNGLALLLALGSASSPGISPFELGVAAVGATLLLAAQLVTVIGLDRRDGWAVTAAGPMVGITLGAAVLAAILAIIRGRLLIPFDGILAVWAFSGSRSVAAPAPLGARGRTVLSVFALAAAVNLAWSAAFTPPGLLDVHQSDLVASLDATCDSSGSLPAVIDVRYRWRWRGIHPFPTGLDAIVVQWTGFDELGRPLYALGDLQATPPGVASGEVSGATAAVATSLTQGIEGSWTWGIDLPAQALGPAELHVRLVAATPGTPVMPSAISGPVTIQATYIHQGFWTSESELTC